MNNSGFCEDDSRYDYKQLDNCMNGLSVITTMACLIKYYVVRVISRPSYYWTLLSRLWADIILPVWPSLPVNKRENVAGISSSAMAIQVNKYFYEQ